ncbi:hypothetical protein ACWDE0_23445 [Streptomyces sp. 900105755]|uniref:hypothetical protein n=1 Tax=unclassified Streptomyces TaxID=2593676 RepID=UPI00089A2734|nr:hypothetical protein [Streptomyces sp. Ag109_O5-10]SEE76958.1 hypothetical protein SAMN05216533_3617 [Streptomyces sp. Ag109_O5-10]
MKIQERTGAGAGRSAGPAQPSVGDRLPTAPRERKPALAALAVLLILLGALGATTLVLQAGKRIEVIKITQEIPAGSSVTGSDVTSVMVADDSSIHYVRWSQLESLKKLKAVSTIPAGVVAVGEMFGSGSKLPAGKSTVGLALKEGQYPSGIEIGDTVAAYRVTGSSSSGGSSSGGSSSSGTDSLITGDARVSAVPEDKSGSDFTASTNYAITLTVNSDKAAELADAASNGEVALVLVPGNGN